MSSTVSQQPAAAAAAEESAPKDVQNIPTPTSSAPSPAVTSSKRTSERIANMNQNMGQCVNSNIKLELLDHEDSASRRRSSSRSIKRKKFDDELVDSMSTSYPKQKCFKSQNSTEFFDGVFGESVPIESTPVKEIIPVCDIPAPSTSKRVNSKVSSGASAKKKKKHTNHYLKNYIVENNYWKPVDDLALILNVEQTNDLKKVYHGVKFSSKFSYPEIESRWRSLLYDINLKSLALAAVRQLHPDVVSSVERKALFSDAEEALLKNLESQHPPSLDSLQELIALNAEVFLPSRTPKMLFNHWKLLRHYQLLNDQTLQPLPRHESVVSFSEIESAVREEIFIEQRSKSPIPPPSDTVNQEIIHNIRKNMLEIRMLENEIPKYQTLLDSITGIAPNDFDSQTYAVLRGRLVRYLMRSKEITIGRSTKDYIVDVDLSLEGPSTKISRLQALICLQPTGEFIMYNSGKRPIYIDSKPLLPNSPLRINHNSLIEFASLKFIFLVNQDLISNMRNEILQVCKY